MRIKCPECDSVLALNQPKPGRYRPKCRHCGQSFLLMIGRGDPPQVAVAREPVASEPESPTSIHPPVSTDSSQTAAAHSNGSGQALNGNLVEESSADPRATVRWDVEVTEAAGQISPAATVDSRVQTTVDRLSGSKPATKTAGGAEATIGGTLDDRRAANSSACSVGGGKSRSISPMVSAAAPSAGVPVATKSDEDAELPEKLGGYRILRLIGRGAMGAVYEAKQISLDRLVALKTIRGRLASNPSSLARFTREAYAAAQLTHHNVVQIYDFGEDAGKHFFSMEWVRGGPLSDLVREKGAIDPRLAASYTLQAARGLQFAHRHGMVHRDVKPANLLLSDEGVVKVADLGLVKIPDQWDPDADVGASSIAGLESGTQVTIQGTAVGTPAYMAPEQSMDAAGVDHRADIYSLGCTLFYLLAGAPPFDGSVVSEVMEQHAKQPLPSLIQINSRVPETLQQIVQWAMAKRPQDRYASLAEMIADLETFLGISREGMFSPSVSQADQWQDLAADYATATPLVRWIKPVFVGLIVVSALLTVVMPLLDWHWLLLGVVLFVTANVTALLLGSGHDQSAIVTSFRRWIGSLSWFDDAVGILGATMCLLVTLVAGLSPGVVAGLILGVLCGAGYHFLLITPTRSNSAAAIKNAERFIRNLRIDGADEDGIRLFAARYGGKRWQGLFEALFGYQALCKVREQLSSDPNFSATVRRPTLRDRICESLSSKAEINRQARDHQRLAKVEQRGLQSEGLSENDARDRAWQMAAAVMDNAKLESATDSEAAAEIKRERMKAMLADARSGKYAKKRDRFSLLRFALGGQTRLLAGCILLAIFSLWAHHSGLLDQVATIAESAASQGSIDAGAVDELKASAAAVDSDSGRNWSIGIAGLLLAMSAFVSGWRMTPFALVATIVILFGPRLGVPGAAGFLEPWMVSSLLGAAIYVPGIVFGEANNA